jgi:hypothetical protein
MDLFEPNERGHPADLAMWLRQVVRMAPWERRSAPAAKEQIDGSAADIVFAYDLAGKQL